MNIETTMAPAQPATALSPTTETIDNRQPPTDSEPEPKDAKSEPAMNPLDAQGDEIRKQIEELQKQQQTIDDRKAMRTQIETMLGEKGYTILDVFPELVTKPKKAVSKKKGEGRHTYINRDTGETTSGRGPIERQKEWLPKTGDPKRKEFKMTEEEQAKWDNENGFA